MNETELAAVPTEKGPYRNLILYYFSGTGNALRAVRWIAEHARARGMEVFVQNIEELKGPVWPAVQGRSLVGFCYPTHGFAPPWLMLKFFFALPRLPDADLFFLNTRAGFRVGPLHAGPGLSGIAMWLPILWFALRGHRIAGSLPLDMPHSWISFFWPNSKVGTGFIVARCQRIVETFCASILAGRRYFRWSIWLTLPIDLAMVPITILYVFMGRFYLAKTLYASYTCNACALCAETCPVQAIEMKDGRPYWKVTCESCMRCMNICPRKSIQSWITRIALLGWVILALGALWIPNDMVWFLLVSVAFFPIYRGLHVLWGMRPINAVFTFTSLTRVWHRYLAPGIKAKDLRTRRRAKAAEAEADESATRCA